MSESNAARSVRAHTIQRSVIMTGDGNMIGHADNPPGDPASSGKAPGGAGVMEAAQQVDALTAHAGAVAERLATLCRWAAGWAGTLLGR